MDGSQKEGGNFLNLHQKEGVPRKGGRSLRKGGGDPTLEETMYSEDFRRPLSCFLTLCAALKGDVSPDKQNYFNITLEIAIFVLA